MTGTEKSFLLVPLYDKRVTCSRAYLSWARHADALIFDLEDSLAPSKKKEGRELLNQIWDQFQTVGKLNIVRINSGEAEQRLDLEAIVPLPNKLILLTKVDGVENVERALPFAQGSDFGVFIETPMGVINVEKIAARPEVKMIFFGPEDLSTRLGVEPTIQSMKYAAAKVAKAAAKYQKRVIGCAGDFRHLGQDGLTKFRMTLEHSRKLGFDGCYAIHYSQLKVINDVFSKTSFQGRQT